MRLLIAALPAIASALPELILQKKSLSDFNGLIPASFLKRRAVSGTLETVPYSVLSWSSGGAYYANVTIGNPPQDQVVILDTGSSDLYFDASSAPSCRETTSKNSCRGGTFNPDNSKTYKVVDPAPAFNTSFGDGSTASGPFSTDTFGIGDVTIQNVQFGVAEQVKSTTGYAIGLMGIGYSQNEATQYVYPNVPEVLKEAGVINSRLYSIYLNDVNTGSGSILFGGIDTSRFNPPLITLNMLADPYTIGTTSIKPQIDQFITTVTALKVNSAGKDSTIWSGGIDSTTAYSDGNKALAVLLDTGSSAWTVPSSYYDSIAKQFSYVDRQGLCACTNRDSGDSLTLTFAGKIQITVPAQEFIVPIYNATTRQPFIYDRAGNTACSFMISPGKSSSGFYTLGDAILRSMYLTYDLDNGQVSIAQAKVNSTDASNIVKVPAGVNGIASVVSGVSTAARPTISIAAPVSATQKYTASTATTTIGTATGVDAVPTEARVLPAPSRAAAAGSCRALSHDYASSMIVLWACFMPAIGAFMLA